jgi:four helix bundle protein
LSIVNGQWSDKDMRDYKKIVAFQLADELVIEIYELTRKFPKEEMYGLTSQIRRAAVSITANIVEGARRASKKEYLQFLHVSQASLSEVEYYIHLSYKLEYLKENEFIKASDLCNKSFSKLYGLIESVKGEL